MAENEIERIKCYQCTMTFRLQDQVFHHGGSQPERLICPDCRRAFWSTGNSIINGKSVSVVGVDPKNHAEWMEGPP